MNAHQYHNKEDIFFLILDESIVHHSKPKTQRGETILIVGSIILLFFILTVGMGILITKRKKRFNEEQYTLMRK